MWRGALALFMWLCIAPRIVRGAACPVVQFLGHMDFCNPSHHTADGGIPPASSSILSMTTGCSPNCQLCPFGTSCLPWNGNETRCVKDSAGLPRISPSFNCGDNQIISQFDTCEYAPSGGSAPREPCTSNLDCMFGFSCSGGQCIGLGDGENCTYHFQCHEGACISSRCKSPEPLGSPCDEVGQDFQCDGDNIVCISAGCVELFSDTLGSPCDPIRPTCAPGFYCGIGNTCQPATHTIFDYQTGVPCNTAGDCSSLGPSVDCFCDTGLGQETCVHRDVTVEQVVMDQYLAGLSCLSSETNCGRRIDRFRSFVGPRDTCVAKSDCASAYACGFVGLMRQYFAPLAMASARMITSDVSFELGADLFAPFLSDYCKDVFTAVPVSGGNKLAELRDNGQTFVEAVNGTEVNSSNVIVVVARILSMRELGPPSFDIPIDVVHVPTYGWSISSETIDGEDILTGEILLSNNATLQISCRLVPNSNPISFAGTTFALHPNAAKVSYFLDGWPGMTNPNTYVRIVLRVSTEDPTTTFEKTVDGGVTRFTATNFKRRISVGFVNSALLGTGEVVSLRTTFSERDQSIRMDVSPLWDGTTGVSIDPDISVTLAGENNGDSSSDGNSDLLTGDGDGDGAEAIYAPIISVLGTVAVLCTILVCLVCVACFALLVSVGTLYSTYIARDKLGAIQTDGAVNFDAGDRVYRSSETSDSL